MSTFVSMDSTTNICFATLNIFWGKYHLYLHRSEWGLQELPEQVSQAPILVQLQTQEIIPNKSMKVLGLMCTIMNNSSNENHCN